MGKRIFTKAVRNWIASEVSRRIPASMDKDSPVILDTVVELIKEMHVYDPIVAEEQWYKNTARKLIASIKDDDGLRTFFSARPVSREFVNIETCTDISKLDAVKYQLTKKRDGLDRHIEKNDRHRAQLTGQTPLRRMVYGNIPFIDLADFL